MFFGAPTDVRLQEKFDAAHASSSAAAIHNSASRLSNVGGETTPSRQQATADGFFSQRSVPRWQNSYRDSTARRAMIDNL